MNVKSKYICISNFVTFERYFYPADPYKYNICDIFFLSSVSKKYSIFVGNNLSKFLFKYSTNTKNGARSFGPHLFSKVNAAEFIESLLSCEDAEDKRIGRLSFYCGTIYIII